MLTSDVTCTPEGALSLVLTTPAFLSHRFVLYNCIFKYSLQCYSLDHVTKDEWQDRNFLAIEIIFGLKVKTEIDIPF